MNNPQRWQINTLLLDMFETLSLEQCDAASQRMVSQGISTTAVVQAHRRLQEALTHPDMEATVRHMKEGGFPVEQILSFLWAPTAEEAAKQELYGAVTRETLLEQMSKERQASLKGVTTSPTLATAAQNIYSAGQGAAKEALKRIPALSALVLIAGVVPTMMFHVGGLVTGNPDLTQTAEVMASAFPSFVGKSLELSTMAISSLATALGVLGYKAHKAMNIAKEHSAIRPEQILALPYAEGQLPLSHRSYATTKRLLEAIPASHQLLLSHLSPTDLRWFLHGNDQLRSQMLEAQPPSYAQRTACAAALEPGFFRQFSNCASLAGASWNGALAHGPVSLGAAIKKMREEVSEQEKPVIPSITVPRLAH